MPLTIYFYERIFDDKKARWALAAGICLISVAVTELHIFFFIFLFSIFYFPIRFLAQKAKESPRISYTKLMKKLR